MMSVTSGLCDHCGKTAETLKRCSRCQQGRYCGPACFKAAWKAGHKLVCNPQHGAKSPIKTKSATELQAEGFAALERGDYRAAVKYFTSGLQNCSQVALRVGMYLERSQAYQALGKPHLAAWDASQALGYIESCLEEGQLCAANLLAEAFYSMGAFNMERGMLDTAMNAFAFAAHTLKSLDDKHWEGDGEWLKETRRRVANLATRLEVARKELQSRKELGEPEADPAAMAQHVLSLRADRNPDDVAREIKKGTWIRIPIDQDIPRLVPCKPLPSRPATQPAAASPQPTKLSLPKGVQPATCACGYLEELSASQSSVVLGMRSTKKGKERGLFATRAFARGDVLFGERPIAFGLFSTDACRFCTIPVEANQAVRCPHCVESYCSEDCRSQAWSLWHERACPKGDPDRVAALEELRASVSEGVTGGSRQPLIVLHIMQLMMQAKAKQQAADKQAADKQAGEKEGEKAADMVATKAEEKDEAGSSGEGNEIRRGLSSEPQAPEASPAVARTAEAQTPCSPPVAPPSNSATSPTPTQPPLFSSNARKERLKARRNAKPSPSQGNAAQPTSQQQPQQAPASQQQPQQAPASQQRPRQKPAQPSFQIVVPPAPMLVQAGGDASGIGARWTLRSLQHMCASNHTVATLTDLMLSWPNLLKLQRIMGALGHPWFDLEWYNETCLKVMTNANELGSKSSNANVHAGTCLYPLYSMINHSCKPNACYYYQGDDDVLIVKALVPIKQGEEVTIAYVDYNQPKKQRDAQLAQYGFSCSCDTCKMQTMMTKMLGVPEFPVIYAPELSGKEHMMPTGRFDMEDLMKALSEGREPTPLPEDPNEPKDPKWEFLKSLAKMGQKKKE